MDRLLGHLAQFGSFSQQGELLCTQGLAYLLRDTEGERVFTGWISKATGHPLSPGLTWQAERVQEDRGRPDLEGRNAEGQPVVKLEAKLGAPFGYRQLESYVSALCAGGRGGTLLVVVPQLRREEITGHVSELFKLAGAGPWRIMREDVAVPCAVVTWEDLLEALSAVERERFRDDLSQFHAMYRAFNGDDMPPITDDEEILAWHDQEAWWELLVERTTRSLTAPGVPVLPFGVDGGAQRYWRRYVCRRVSQVWSCYSVGTRDPFQNHRTPVWLRLHKGTGHFHEIAGRLEGSALGAAAVRSQGHLWFPLAVPLNSDRAAMIGALVAQVQRIMEVAYPPAASEEPHPAP
ncbi:MAG: hypothetical protein WCQ45_05575 [bacterium]